MIDDIEQPGQDARTTVVPIKGVADVSNIRVTQPRIDFDTLQRQFANVGPRQNPLIPAPNEAPEIDQDALNIVNQSRDAMQASLMNATQYSPDEAAEAQRLGAPMKLNYDLVLRNKDQVKHAAMMQDIDRRDLMRNDPILARQLQNLDFAAIAYDDLDNLSQNGSIFKDIASAIGGRPWEMQDIPREIVRGYLRGEAVAERGRVGTQIMLEGETAATAEQVRQLRESMMQLEQFGESGFLSLGAEMVAQNVAGIREVAATTLTGAAIGTGIFPGVGTMGGAYGGFQAGSFLTTARMEAGNAYLDMIEAGVNEDDAKYAAIGTGLVNGLIEVAFQKFAAAPFKGIANKLLRNQINQTLVRPTTRKALADAAKSYVTTVAGEAGEEGLQQLTNIVNRNVARTMSGMDPDVTASQAGAEIVDSFIAGAMGSAIIGGAGPTINVYADIVRANAATRQADFFERLNTNAAAAKVRARNATAYEQFLAAQAQGTAAETIYVDGTVAQGILRQSGITPQQLDAVVPGLYDRVREAAAAGGDVQIPTAQYGARMAGTELGNALTPHLRLAPDAMSAAQAQQFAAEKQNLVDEAKRILEEKKTTETAFVDDALAFEERILAQITEAGKTLETPLTKTQAQAAAKVYQAMYVNLAARAGKTVTQLEQEIGSPLQIRGARAVAAPLEQAPTVDVSGVATPQYRRAWHRATTGQPITVTTWHAPGGTEAAQLTDFARERMGRDTTLGAGWYGARDRDVSEIYGKPEQFEVTLQNPFVFSEPSKNFVLKLTNEELQRIRDAGHDGIIVKGVNATLQGQDRSHLQVVAFNPEQSVRVIAPAGAPGVMEQASRIDADYMAAVKRGDTEAAQRMVDEAAKASGYTVRAFHGTDAEPFTVFGNYDAYNFGDAAYFSPNEQYARSYAESHRTGRGQPRVLNVALRVENTFSPETNADHLKLYRKWTKEAKRLQRHSVFQVWGPLAEPYGENKVRNLVNWEDQWWLVEKIREAGFDSFTTSESDGETIAYGILNPNQIKLADAITRDEAGNVVPLSRRFNITSPMIFEQAAVQPRLMAVHNLSADNLQFADQMGGLAVPSIGVITQERGGVEGFGDITLLGTREMADPATSRVFSSDAYSARFPSAEWPKVPSAKADKFVAQLRAVAKKYDDRRIIDETFDAMVNNPNAEKVVGYWMRSMAVRALFLSENGIDIAPVMRAKKTLSGLSWDQIDALRTAYEAVDQNLAYSDMEASPEYQALKDRYAAAIRQKFEPARDDIDSATIERWASDFTPTTLSRLQRDMADTERTAVDSIATGEAVDAAMDPLKAEFKSWVDTKVRNQFGAPFIRIGRTRKPYTLNNIVDVMTSEKVRGEEKAMTFGAGAARAAAATEFVDLEQMREAAKSAIVSPDEYAKASKSSNAELEAYRNAVIDYTTLTDWRGKSDTWAALDGSMRALATYGTSKRKGPATMRRVLAQEGFASERIPNDLIDQAIAAAETLFNAPVPYFEAKPQRAVRLSEFGGAVIPSDASQEVRDILERNGIAYMTYLAGNEEDRQRAVRQMAESPEARGQVLFQAGDQAARGGIDVTTLLITIGKSADITTLGHEAAHAYFEILGRLAAAPNAPEFFRNDMDILLRFGKIAGDTPEARLATWNATTLDGRRKLHEAFAYNFEIYLFEGKSPSVEMQGLFDRFASWLKRVYKSLRDDLNAIYRREFGEDMPVLTGEVREVMDRMLASDEQIKRQREVQGMKPLLTGRPDGMSDTDWAEYQLLSEQDLNAAIQKLTEASVRNMEWLSNAKSRLIKSLQAKHAKLRKEMRERIATEVAAQPEYRTLKYLRTGMMQAVDGTEVQAEGVTKLNAARVDEIANATTMAQMFDTTTIPKGITVEGGQDPDVVAEMFGFSSGSDMILRISAAKPIKEAIDEQLDARMEAEYGDMFTPAEVEKQVNKALHNEVRARMVATELKWAAKATQPVRAMLEAARQVARETIGSTLVGELKPAQFIAAEARAAKDALGIFETPMEPEAIARSTYSRVYNRQKAAGATEEAAVASATAEATTAAARAMERVQAFRARYKDGDREQLIVQAKRRQLLQNQLASAAIETQEEIDKAIKGFRKFFKADAKIAESRDLAMVMAARAILASRGIGRSDKAPAAYVEQLQANNPGLYAELAPIIMQAGVGDYRKMTVSEFRVIAESVEALWSRARRDRQIQVGEQKVELDLVVSEMIAAMEKIKRSAVQPGVREAVGFKDVAKRQAMEVRAANRRVESWSDALDAADTKRPFTTYLWQPVKDAVVRFRQIRNDKVKKLYELVMQLDIPKNSIDAPELDYTFGRGNAGAGKAELLGAMLHAGNESNYRKLLLGRQWATLDEAGNMDDSRWKRFVDRMIAQGVLTKADFDFLQAVWDLNEEIKPLLQKAHYDLEGYYFKEVQATPVVTPFGTYRGGYVPAATDRFMVADAVQRAGMQELEQDWRFSLPSTGMGMTKARVESYTKPLALDIRLIVTHVDAALRFAIIQPAVVDALKILKNRSFAAEIDKIDPTAITAMLLPWLNRSAHQTVSQPGRFKSVDAFWRGVRTRTGMSIMFANLRNAFQQITGLFPSALKVSPVYLKNAVATYLGDPRGTANMIAATDPFMDQRMRDQVYEMQEQMNDLLLNPSKFDKVQAWNKQHAYFIQTAFQNQVDIITWLGAYNQSLAESGVGVSEEKARKQAIRDAGAAVRLTQGSIMPEDISAFEAGTPFYRIFTQFAGYFNGIANLNATEMVKTVRTMGFRGGKGKLLYIYLLGFAMPAIVSDAIVRSMGGGWDDDDEDGYLDVFMDWFFGSQIRMGAAFIPFGSTALQAITTPFDNKPYNDRMNNSPSIQALESATIGTGKAIVNVVDEDKELTGKNVRDVLTAVSLATGIPVSVLGRPAGYLVDVYRGEIEPEGPIDFTLGILTGTTAPSTRR